MAGMDSTAVMDSTAAMHSAAQGIPPPVDIGPSWVAIVALVVLGIAAAYVAFAVMRAPVRDLITRTIGLDPAAKFYERVLILGLVYIAIATVFNASFVARQKQTFMTTVWDILNNLDSLMYWLFGFIALYSILITIIVAAYGRRHDR